MLDIEAYNARRTAMVAKQEELRLLLPPEAAIQKHDVDVYLDQVDVGTKNVMDRLRVALTPYALARHSALTDKRQRPDELLYIEPLKKEVSPLVFPVLRLMGLALNPLLGHPWEKEEINKNPRLGTIKFAQRSQTQGYNVFVSMEYQEVQPKGTVDYLCRRVVFCETPEDNIRSASNKYFLANADDERLNSIVILGVPNYTNYLVELYFDYSGSIKEITHLDKDRESLTAYRFNRKGFDVRRYIGVQRGGRDLKKLNIISLKMEISENNQWLLIPRLSRKTFCK